MESNLQQELLTEIRAFRSELITSLREVRNALSEHEKVDAAQHADHENRVHNLEIGTSNHWGQHTSRDWKIFTALSGALVAAGIYIWHLVTGK